MNSTPADSFQPSNSSQFAIAQIFANPNPDTSDSSSDAFGSEIAIDGNKVLVGARFDGTFGDNSGGAYLFDTENGSLDLTFTYPGLDSRDTFGTALAIDGDRALIAATGDDTGGNDSGTVFLFDTSNGDVLQNFSLADTVVFGSSVAIDENEVLVGDVQNNTFANVGGAAFLFDAETGNSTQSFFPADPSTKDFFAGSIAIEDDKILVGSTGDDIENNSGAAFLYDANDGSLIQSFFSPNPSTEDSFGSSIAIDGDKVLIGAISDDTFGEDSGAAYLFDTDGNLLQTFSPPDPVGGELFSTDVDLDGDKVLIGARGDDTFGEDSGAAFLYDANNGNLLQSLYANTPNAGDDFGFSVGIEDESLVVGAPNASEGENEGGIVYLFEPSDLEPPNTITGTSGSDRLIGTQDNESLLGLAGNDLILGKAGDDILDGGAGDDRLIGNKGADQFVLRAGDGNDTIIGFEDGIDSFSLADGLTFEDLTISQSRGRSVISVASTSEDLASLFGIDANDLSSEDLALASASDSN